MSAAESPDTTDGTEQLPPDAVETTAECTTCGATIRTNDRYCESCGADQAMRSRWAIEVMVDRRYFQRMQTEGIAVPDGRPAKMLEFVVDQVTIGRASRSRDTDPDLDLSQDLADPGASHQHAVIRRIGPERYELVDLGSTNGTRINDDTEPIAPHRPADVRPGDRIHIGAWTVLTITSPATR